MMRIGVDIGGTKIKAGGVVLGPVGDAPQIIAAEAIPTPHLPPDPFYDALAALKAYPWPGNVRELQNVIERACALADGDQVTRRDLPDYVLRGVEGAVVAPGSAGVGGGGAADTGLDLPLKEAKERWMQVLEANYLRELLDRHDGNISAAAKSAGIDRKTFHRLVTKYQIRS